MNGFEKKAAAAKAARTVSVTLFVKSERIKMNRRHKKKTIFILQTHILLHNGKRMKRE